MGYGSGLYQPGRDRTISCWMPLVAVDETSACLQVCTGSNKAGPRPMVKLPNNGLVGLADEEILPYQPVSVPMQPGDVLLFDEQTFHRSLPNSSGRTRWSLDIRFSDARNLPNIELVNTYINQKRQSGSTSWGSSVGYRCASEDTTQLGTFADWKAHFDYSAEF